ncbi:hypothetical protein ABZ892_11695 [Streptomyces sp. NPDC046924]
MGGHAAPGSGSPSGGMEHGDSGRVFRTVSELDIHYRRSPASSTGPRSSR